MGVGVQPCCCKSFFSYDSFSAKRQGDRFADIIVAENISRNTIWNATDSSSKTYVNKLGYSWSYIDIDGTQNEVYGVRRTINARISRSGFLGQENTTLGFLPSDVEPRAIKVEPSIGKLFFLAMVPSSSETRAYSTNMDGSGVTLHKSWQWIGDSTVYDRPTALRITIDQLGQKVYIFVLRETQNGPVETYKAEYELYRYSLDFTNEQLIFTSDLLDGTLRGLAWDYFAGRIIWARNTGVVTDRLQIRKMNADGTDDSLLFEGGAGEHCSNVFVRADTGDIWWHGWPIGTYVPDDNRGLGFVSTDGSKKTMIARDVLVVVDGGIGPAHIIPGPGYNKMDEFG